MRVCGLLLLAILGGCGGGGGGGTSQSAVVDFGLVAADAPTVREVRFQNPTGGPGSLEADATTGPFRAADGELPALAPGGGEFAVRVRFDPPGPGDHQGSVSVRFVPAGGGSPAVVTVALAATAEAARPAILTKSLDFGEVLMTEKATRRVTVTNSAQKTACNLGAPSLPAAFSIPATIFPLRIAPQDTVTLDVQYAPVALGIPSFDLVFLYDAGSVKLPVKATTSTWPEHMIVDLGNAAVDAKGDTEWLEVQATPHTISVTMEATATTDNTIECTAIEWPTGFSPPMPPWGLDWMGTKLGIRSVTVPWTDHTDYQLTPGGGTYKVRFRRETGTAATLKVRAILKNRPGAVVSGGVLDLNVFVTANLHITPEQVPLWAQATIAGADAIFAQVGLKIGDVKGYVLDPKFDTPILPGDPRPINEVFLESAKAQDERLNVFVVGIPLAGVAGMIQGPASNGWAESGVAVSGFGNSTVLAHEIGHYLGLHHPPADAITDTGAAGNNLMYTGTVLTPGQGHVILRHPLVRAP